MSSIQNTKHLFFTTSPRSPEKMIPEIDFLAKHFSGQPWNPATQADFMQRLCKESDFYEGSGTFKDAAFSARDRINRAPQLLGYVDLSPRVGLTPAGEKLVTAKRTDEVFLRQLLKFQLPSPYHSVSDAENSIFWVRPYLEIIRLVYDLGSLSFDEAMFFGLQLTDYRKYCVIKKKIEDFRRKKTLMAGRYTELKKQTRLAVVSEIFADEISHENYATRESVSSNLDEFVSKKISTMRDYTDACFRYIRSTGLFEVSSSSRSLSVMADRVDDIVHILENTPRDPVFVNDINAYKTYLFDSDTPVLLTDDRGSLVKKLRGLGVPAEGSFEQSADDLKQMLAEALERRKQAAVAEQVRKIKDYSQYDSIVKLYGDITDRKTFDASLMLEWNTWRAMTMLDGGDIRANLKFDDHGQPMSTAQGNAPDIECYYGDYGLTVEVTMSSGQRQYEMEGEPVSRHLAKFKSKTKKDAYCLFIAPSISEASISHFYMLHKVNIAYYGGKSVIVPMTIQTFLKVLENSYTSDYPPDSAKVKELFTHSLQVASESGSEVEWYEAVTKKALDWLAVHAG